MAMKFRTIKLPDSERFACSARELKAAFSDIENLEVYCGVLGKSFSFDSRSKKRPRLQGLVVAEAIEWSGREPKKHVMRFL
jgi:hypothetical protein